DLEVAATGQGDATVQAAHRDIVVERLGVDRTGDHRRDDADAGRQGQREVRARTTRVPGPLGITRYARDLDRDADAPCRFAQIDPRPRQIRVDALDHRMRRQSTLRAGTQMQVAEAVVDDQAGRVRWPWPFSGLALDGKARVPALGR